MNLAKRKTLKSMVVTKTVVTHSIKAVIALAVLVVVAQPAFALNGGFATASTTLTEFKTWMYALVGVGAIVALLWKAVMCMGARAQWSEYGTTVMYVAIAGGSIIFAGNAYTWFAGG